MLDPLTEAAVELPDGRAVKTTTDITAVAGELCRRLPAETMASMCRQTVHHNVRSTCEGTPAGFSERRRRCTTVS